MRKLLILLIIVIGGSSKNTYSQAWHSLAGGFDDKVNSVAFFRGDIIAAGEFQNTTRSSIDHIARWDGNQWIAMGQGLNGKVYTLHVHNGLLYAGGSFTFSGSTSVSYIAKWDGSTWSALGSGVNNRVNALASFGGSLIAGGDFTTAGGTSCNFIAQWNGSSWSSMGGGLSSTVWSLYTHNTQLYAGGSFNGHIAVWSGLWSVMPSSPGNTVRSIAFYNNQIVTGGDFNGFIRTWDGTSWQLFRGGVDDKVQSIKRFRDGLIVGGKFDNADIGGQNIAVGNIAFVNNSGWQALGSGVDDEVYSVTVENDYRCAIAGKFEMAGGDTVNNIALWDKIRSVTGSVISSSDRRSITGGKILAIRIDSATKKVIISDSADIQSDGSFTLSNVPPTPHYCIGFPDDDEDFVPTYYPAKTSWSDANVFAGDTNIQDLIFPVVPIEEDIIFPGVVQGNVRLNFTPPHINFLRDLGSLVYIKQNNLYKGYAVTGSGIRFGITSLDEGEYQVAADRIGFFGEEKTIQLDYTIGNILDSVNFLLNPVDVILTITNNNTNAKAYILNQNYPNPFNPVTKISFSIPVEGFTSLEVYSASGKRVAVLINKELNQGQHQFTFDASGLSSGIYFYKLKTGEYTETKKMALIK